MIYFLFFILVLFFSLIEICNPSLSTKKIFLLIAVVCFFFIGLRETGYDYYGYYAVFEKIKANDLRFVSMEWGFLTLTKFCTSYRVLLLVMAFITIFSNSIAVLKMSKMPCISMLIIASTLLYPTYMGQIRQGVAIGLGLLAIHFLSEGEKKYSVVMILGAYLFHASSLFLIMIYLCKSTFKSVKWYVIGIIIAFIFGTLFNPLQSAISVYLPDIFSDKMAYYSGVEDNEIGLTGALIIRILIFMVALKTFKQPKQILFSNIYYLSIIVYLGFGFIPQVGGRGCLYFSAMDSILVANIIYAYRYRISKYQLYCALFLLISIIRYVFFFLNDFNYNEYVPYFKGELG